MKGEEIKNKDTKGKLHERGKRADRKGHYKRRKKKGFGGTRRLGKKIE